MSTQVEIEYCVPCGHLDRAMETQRSILEHFGRRVEGVALKTGEGGVFTIRADGEEIYDNSQSPRSGPTIRRPRIARLSLTTFPDWSRR